jgi:hypothetical protein
MISAQQIRTDTSDDYDGSIKTKKIKTTKDNGSRKPVANIEPTTKPTYKSNSKNTYINKITSLISDPAELNTDEKMYKSIRSVLDCSIKQVITPDASKKSTGIKNEASETATQKGGMKRIRSFDVLKSDEIGFLSLLFN